MRRTRRVKIVATLGPASYAPEMIERLFEAGVDVFRINMSHSSFDLVKKRVEEGGWTHEVTERVLPSSRDIGGVNMRLTAGGIRELHWHLAAEWAIMTYGSCRVTILDEQGRAYVADVKEGDLWYFPAGMPHSPTRNSISSTIAGCALPSAVS